MQAIYICSTCTDANSENRLCCCAACAEFCHEGHDVDFFAFGNAYCDCGLSACELIRESNKSRTQHISPINPTLLSRRFDLPLFQSFKIHTDSPINIQSLQLQCKSLTNLSKDTFWIGLNDSPRCSFETMALSILREHLSKQSLAVTSSAGAEWWVQYKEMKMDLSSEEGEGESRNGSIDLHYDKDEDIAATFGIGIFPVLSTVTYLSSSSFATPTIVFANEASSPIGEPIRNCFVSYPALGKHIAFAGQLLHGAPIELLRESQSHEKLLSAAAASIQCRVTFLVNIWIDHQPSDVSPVPLEYLRQLNLSADNIYLSLNPNAETVATTKVGKKTVKDLNAGTDIAIPFVSASSAWGIDPDETGLCLHMFLPSACSLSQNHVSSLVSTYHIVYTHADVAAVLDYEDDEEDLLNYTKCKLAI